MQLFKHLINSCLNTGMATYPSIVPFVDIGHPFICSVFGLSKSGCSPYMLCDGAEYNLSILIVGYFDKRVS